MDRMMAEATHWDNGWVTPKESRRYPCFAPISLIECKSIGRKYIKQETSSILRILCLNWMPRTTSSLFLLLLLSETRSQTFSFLEVSFWTVWIVWPQVFAIEAQNGLIKIVGVVWNRECGLLWLEILHHFQVKAKMMGENTKVILLGTHGWPWFWNGR